MTKFNMSVKSMRISLDHFVYCIVLYKCKTIFSICGSFMFLFCLVFAMSLCASVCVCFVVICWERADPARSGIDTIKYRT